MVRAYHLILTDYGFWLPNDPRGSWSDFVRSIELYRQAGPATKVTTQQSVAHKSHNHQQRRQAKQALKYPPVVFTGHQARAVTQGFADYITKNNRRVFACAVMPNHAHFVIQRCERPIEIVAEHLKARATTFLNRQNLHPLQPHTPLNRRPPTPWARHSWSVFLSGHRDIARTIRYVEQNPIKAGHRPQHYDWVTPFTPNSA
ncbi:MAG: hypothetical protein AAF750_09960 [Planctomycetota bacterium]